MVPRVKHIPILEMTGLEFAYLFIDYFCGMINWVDSCMRQWLFDSYMYLKFHSSWILKMYNSCFDLFFSCTIFRSRLLRASLLQPLKDVTTINTRLDCLVWSAMTTFCIYLSSRILIFKATIHCIVLTVNCICIFIYPWLVCSCNQKCNEHG